MRRIIPVLFSLSATALASEAVRTTSGLVTGIAGKDPSVAAYLGIPYAGPASGPMRWKPPRPAPKWDGVKQAREFGPVCYQAPYAKTSIYYRPPVPMSEDCLSLNVWTAAKPSDRRPVMVWIHGGALTRGSGSTPTYNGEAFARKGVVLVTINYRLGIPGFLAHPELTKESAHGASGNYALLDQIAALRWVRDMDYWVNFARSGDPNGKGLPAWPAYQRESDQWLILGDRVEVRSKLFQTQLDFLDRAVPRGPR